MDDDELITQALAHAARAHRGQGDKRGRPYIKHVTEVSAAVDHEGTYPILVALLHDVLEDTNDTDLSAYPSRCKKPSRPAPAKRGRRTTPTSTASPRTPLARTVKLSDLRLNHATAPRRASRG